MSMIARVALLLSLIVVTPAPAAAQFSDSYTFLKAIKDKDIIKARSFIDRPGSAVLEARDGEGDTALHIVTKRRDAPWLSYLLQQGADPNSKDRAGDTPLAIASRIGFSEAIRLLLIVKARVDQPNARGETPLILAVQARDAVSAKLLLDAGASPGLTDGAAGYSAREYARQLRGSPALARLLGDATKGQRAAVGAAGPRP